MSKTDPSVPLMPGDSAFLFLSPNRLAAKLPRMMDRRLFSQEWGRMKLGAFPLEFAAWVVRDVLSRGFR